MMATNENDRNTGQNPGFKQNQAQKQRDHEGEQNAYGQSRNATNLNSEKKSTEGRDSDAERKSEDKSYTSTKQQDGRHNEDDPNGMKSGDKVVPEVPNREEKREQKTPQAEKTANNEGMNRFDSDKGNRDNSSKFSK